MAIKRLKVLLLLLLFSWCMPLLVSQEKEQDQEVMPLGYIDHLISTNEYSKALEQLSLYIIKYPDQFDKAQKRISKVIKARNKFNRKAFELAEKMKISAEATDLTDEQIDNLDSQKMDIIFALEKSEENAAQEEIDLTNDARRTVRLAFYINRSNLIVNQGTHYIEEATLDKHENYNLAFEKFKEGLGLKTSDSDIVFNGEEEIPVVYSSDFNKEVDNHIAQVKKFSLSVKSQFLDCQNAYDAYMTALQQEDSKKSQEALSALEKVFSRLASTRNTLYREGNELVRLDKQALKENPGLGDTSYVTFNKWAVTGVDGNPDSGLVGAIDAFFNSHVEDMKTAVYKKIAEQFDFIALTLKLDENFFEVTDYSQASASRQFVADYTEQGTVIQNLYSNLKDSPAENFKEYKVSMDFFNSFAKKELRNAMTVSRNIAQQNVVLASRQVENDDFVKYGKESVESVNYYEKQHQSILNLEKSKLIAEEKNRQNSITTFNTEETENVEIEPEKPVRTTAGVQLKDEILDSKNCLVLFDKIISLSNKECTEQKGHVWSIIARTYSQEADNQFASLALRHTQANTLLNGVEEVSGETIIKKYYPTKAAEECVKLNSDINKSISVLSGYRQTLEGGSKYKNSEEVYAAGVLNIESTLISLKELLTKNNTIIAQAKTKANSAKKAANEARQKFDLAVKYLNSNKYDESRQALSEADDSYKKSLGLEENDAFRQEFSAKIAQTDEDITARQNAWVITTVRNLITEAYNDYYAGNFENSKKGLEDATDIWEKTQAQENTEIKELLVLVKEALESTGGKEIAFSDPLYKDMGAFLSNARSHYEEGASLWKKGNTEDGTALLTTARDEVRKVQRVFPKNLEANNLNLLINKVLDPSVYEATVNQKITQAKTNANSGKDVDIKTALNDLKELQLIIPENKQVASVIKELEGRLAKNAQSEQIKKERARSEMLTKQAQAETNITRKIALLDEALSLNRRNTTAQKLKDQTFIQNNARTTIKNYLDDSDEVKYTQAERYYNDGLKDQASAIIGDLYRRNPQVAKVIKLKRRIENM